MTKLPRSDSIRARPIARRGVPDGVALSARRAGRPLERQRGVVLLYALVAMVLLMVSGLALVRGMGTSIAISGNFALRRDLLNEGEQGVVAAEAAFTTGALATAANRTSVNTAANYSPTTLPTDNNGIPLALLNDTQFTGIGLATNDLTPESGVTVRYVIDRLCVAGTTTPVYSDCAAYTGATKPRGDLRQNGAGGPFQPVYRVTVRVTGPKNSMTFLQTTIGA
jgi:Tfp pilus assembly protein PilX